MKRALLSVYDKTGIVDLAQTLIKLGVEIVSTGGTHRLLQDAGLPVTGVSDITGFPEIMDGRVKTLHPRIHGGLLAVRSNAEHMAAIEKLEITPIDLVVVNLYPFQETVLREGVTHEEIIENIDIGGPSMLRAAAKNYQDVLVVVDPADYGMIIEKLSTQQSFSDEERLALAAKVFRHTGSYDALVGQYLTQQTGERFPERLNLTFEKQQDLRYGENPHQQAAFYREAAADQGTISGAKQLHGKELSYNNIQDAQAALSIVREFSEPAVVAVKHTNPCGVGVGETILAAYQKTYEADPVSIFGGIIALNRPVAADTASKMAELFLEIIIAPAFDAEAMDILMKKKNIRLLQLDITPAVANQGTNTPLGQPFAAVKVAGGLLVQDVDAGALLEDQWQVVTDRQPTDAEWNELRFAWKVVKHVKSNAIVVSRDNRTVGIGAGQMNRVGAAKIALEQAGELAHGAVLASDAFFPMSDTLELAVAAGVRAVIQPGGSIRDAESIEAANRHGITMIFTKMRHFKH